MDDGNFELAAGLVSHSYVAQGQQALTRRRRLVKALLSSRQLPAKGWDEATIDMLVKVSPLPRPRDFSCQSLTPTETTEYASVYNAAAHYV